MVASYSGGTFTINPSGPGAIAGTSVSHTGYTATTNIAVCITTRSEDALGGFNDLIIVPGSGAFTATCVKRQLINTLTANFVLVNTA